MRDANTRPPGTAASTRKHCILFVDTVSRNVFPPPTTRSGNFVGAVLYRYCRANRVEGTPARVCYCCTLFPPPSAPVVVCALLRPARPRSPCNGSGKSFRNARRSALLFGARKLAYVFLLSFRLVWPGGRAGDGRGQQTVLRVRLFSIRTYVFDRIRRKRRPGSARKPRTVPCDEFRTASRENRA